LIFLSDILLISVKHNTNSSGDLVMTKPVIGFIGLGLMGGNMVENLQKRDSSQ
jgi:hypothetical protein